MNRIPTLARRVKRMATSQIFNLRQLLNGESGRGLAGFRKLYDLGEEIGRGGFGVVYRATRISDDLPVAVKFIDRKSIREWGKLGDSQVPMEIYVLSKCAKIPGVIRLLDWYSTSEGFLIVMERPFPCTDLFDFLKLQTKLDENTARWFFRQIVQTVQQCAEKRILHRDIKDENIVIDLVTGEAKLIDFGAATALKKSQYSDFQGTRLYCPPEWFLRSLYLGKEATVWSLGVLLYNMLNGRVPYRNEKDICTSHLLGALPFYSSVSTEARDLVLQCLSYEPYDRCSLEEILIHPWMTADCPDWVTLTKNLNAGLKKDDEDEANVSGGEISAEAERKSKMQQANQKKFEKLESSGVGSLDGPSGARGAKTSLLSLPPTRAQLVQAEQRPTRGPLTAASATCRRPKKAPEVGMPAANSTVLATIRRAMKQPALAQY
ncbi:unnamed protein product, partial [Mesorhabditis spiculigera]